MAETLLKVISLKQVVYSQGGKPLFAAYRQGLSIFAEMGIAATAYLQKIPERWALRSDSGNYRKKYSHLLASHPQILLTQQQNVNSYREDCLKN
ncbi:MAG: hypothetical protein R3D00_21215 [Bacteroidia bacterium]